MASQNDQRNEPIGQLRERAKELECLYSVEKILSDVNLAIVTVCRRIVDVFPAVWQHGDIRRARIELSNQTFDSPGFVETACHQDAGIQLQGITVGTISIHHGGPAQRAGDRPFLQRESRLLLTIAARLGFFLEDRQLRRLFAQTWGDRKDLSEPEAIA